MDYCKNITLLYRFIWKYPVALSKQLKNPNPAILLLYKAWRVILFTKGTPGFIHDNNWDFYGYKNFHID